MTNREHGSPHFYQLINEMADLHEAKSHDYAKDSDPSGNYHFAGYVASLFAHSPDDAGFAGRLAEKIFRLSVLESGRLQPKNESVADTDLDIAVIAALWMADRRDRRAKQSPLTNSNHEAVSVILREFPKLDEQGLRGVVDFLRRALADMESASGSKI